MLCFSLLAFLFAVRLELGSSGLGIHRSSSSSTSSTRSESAAVSDGGDRAGDLPDVAGNDDQAGGGHDGSFAALDGTHNLNARMNALELQAALTKLGTGVLPNRRRMHPCLPPVLRSRAHLLPCLCRSFGQGCLRNRTTLPATAAKASPGGPTRRATTGPRSKQRCSKVCLFVGLFVCLSRGLKVNLLLLLLAAYSSTLALFRGRSSFAQSFPSVSY